MGCVPAAALLASGDADDELVVAQFDNNLVIWSIPEGRGDRTIDQSLLSLTGYQHADATVSYNKTTSTLDRGGLIKYTYIFLQLLHKSIIAS